MEFGFKKLREIDLFDFTSFLAWTVHINNCNDVLICFCQTINPYKWKYKYVALKIKAVIKFANYVGTYFWNISVI